MNTKLRCLEKILLILKPQTAISVMSLLDLVMYQFVVKMTLFDSRQNDCILNLWWLKTKWLKTKWLKTKDKRQKHPWQNDCKQNKYRQNDQRRNE